MVWVKDYQNLMVNIDKFTRVEWVGITDQKHKQKTLCFKIYLSNLSLEDDYILGFVTNKNDPEEVIENLTKGVGYYFESLHGLVYTYLAHDISEISYSDNEKSFNRDFDRISDYVKKEIENNRFTEDFCE